jgi:hypothetical protein
MDMDSSNNPINYVKKIRDYETGLGFRTIIIAINVEKLSDNLNNAIAYGIDEYVYIPFELSNLVTKLKIHFSKN